MRANSKAFDQGIKVGGEYISHVNIREKTMSEMGVIARQRAKECYKTEPKQQEFIQGWLALAQQYQTMFKDYPTKLQVVGIIFKCEHCKTTFEIEYDEPVTFSDLSKEKSKSCPICHDTGKPVNQ
jgi:rubrerythrin